MENGGCRKACQNSDHKICHKVNPPFLSSLRPHLKYDRMKAKNFFACRKFSSTDHRNVWFYVFYLLFFCGFLDSSMSFFISLNNCNILTFKSYFIYRYFILCLWFCAPTIPKISFGPNLQPQKRERSQSTAELAPFPFLISQPVIRQSLGGLAVGTGNPTANEHKKAFSPRKVVYRKYKTYMWINYEHLKKNVRFFTNFVGRGNTQCVHL